MISTKVRHLGGKRKGNTMPNTNVNVAGVVKFFNNTKAFGIIVTKDADVFIHVTKCAGRQAELVEGAEVRIDYLTTYKEGQYKHAVTTLISVKAPEPVEETVILSTVAFYNSEKGFGGVHCGDTFSKPTAHLQGKVCREAGIEPGRGMPLRAVVIEGPQGPLVTSFQWGMQVEADYAAANPEVTEVGTLKYFDPKGFGTLFREDGSTIGFHISTVAEDLRDNFKRKYRKGSTFTFAVGDYRGKETALIRELIALAPEREVAAVEGVEAAESGEVVAVEAVASTEEAVTAPEVVEVEAAAVVESEAKPAKVKRKKATKPEAEVPAKPKAKRVRKPKEAKAAPEPVEEAPADLAAMAKSACANGGGALAQAMLAAATPAGHA